MVGSTLARRISTASEKASVALCPARASLWRASTRMASRTDTTDSCSATAHTMTASGSMAKGKETFRVRLRRKKSRIDLRRTACQVPALLTTRKIWAKESYKDWNLLFASRRTMSLPLIARQNKIKIKEDKTKRTRRSRPGKLKPGRRNSSAPTGVRTE